MTRPNDDQEPVATNEDEVDLEAEEKTRRLRAELDVLEAIVHEGVYWPTDH